MSKELDFYNKVKDWDFSMINYESECLTNWNYEEIVSQNINENTVVLDLGTGGGEKVLKRFPKAKEIIATDFSEEMVKTAKENLVKYGRENENIIFRQMDNLNMDVPDNYFDVVTARHTCTDPKAIFRVLKDGGKLILRGVDKLDCWSLKRLFKKGQAYEDNKPISLIDYENILDAGFKHVELVPIHVREYYKTKEDLLALLYKTPILCDFSEIEENDNLSFDIDMNLIDQYIRENTFDKGILLIRRYYGIIAEK